MAIASSLFSPKSLMDRFRNPVFIASALSLGAHGVFFAAMPMLSASEDLQDQEESVPVVALSAEESQRLPDAVQNNSASAFFNNDPLVTQEGDSLLPVPGIPPYGDLTGLNSGFNDPLQTAPPPLWGNPVDIFQGSLPAIPDETSVIFPSTNSFDSLGSSEPFGLELNDDTTFDDDADIGDDNSEIARSDDSSANIASEDQPLFSDEDEVLESDLNAPLVADEDGTTVDNAFGGGQPPQAPVDPDKLAANLGEEGEATSTDATQNNDASATLAENDPALLALKAEQQRLRDGYRNNGSNAADWGQVGESLGQLASKQSVALKPAQTLVAQYPDPNFKCPADARPALFNLVTQKDGSTLEPELVQSTQYSALDAAAKEAATAFASDLTDPGVYQLSINFEDETGRCAAQDVLS